MGTAKSGLSNVKLAGKGTLEGTERLRLVNSSPKLSTDLSSDVLLRHKRSHQQYATNKDNVQRSDLPYNEKSGAILTPPSIELHESPREGQSKGTPTLTSGQDRSFPEAQQIATLGYPDPLSDIETTSWFLGTDFDLSVLDFSLSPAFSERTHIHQTINGQAEGELLQIRESIRNVDMGYPPRTTVQSQWFSIMREQENQLEKEPSSQKLQADESYRAGLTRKLQQLPQEENLPSSQQLNLFVKLYFTHFHPLFPVVHAATFRPTSENALLFLSICSVGSLFVGSERAAAQGSRIFERLNKTILASWESVISRSSSDSLSMVQAAIIGQTFAILSGNPRYLVLADILHGTVVSWARECNRRFAKRPPVHNMSLTEQNMDEKWQMWIEEELRARVQVALHIHDAELASLMHHEPVFRHKWKLYPRLACDALFNAPTTSKWAALYRQSQSSPHLADMVLVSPPADHFNKACGDSLFSAYSILESINVRLEGARRSDSFDSDMSNKVSHMLICWWRTYSQGNTKLLQQDPFCLTILWHSTFISLYADLDILERAIGRDGNDAAMDTFYPVCEWALSLNADRCLVHALLIQRHLEAMRVSSEPAIHVPRAIFIASLTWLCFTRFTSNRDVNTEALKSPEIKLLGADATECFHEAQGQAFGESVFGDVNHLHRLIDLLQRIGRWGISQSFANVLSAALEEGVDTS